MSIPLFSRLAHIRERMETAQHMLLGLDYDGTLTPIVDDPARAMLSLASKKLLCALSRRPDVSVAVVSGRALDDLRSRVGVKNLIYGGNHGMDISGPGMRYVDPLAVTEHDRLGQVAQSLARRLQSINGAVVENKTLTLSVHYRHVVQHELQAVRQAIAGALAEAQHRFCMALGHKVFEIRPRADWHKGQAIRWIRDRLGQADPLVFYLGDDKTDEDAFKAVQDGITIKVGDPSGSSARYCVEDPKQVKEFLTWVMETTVEATTESTP